MKKTSGGDMSPARTALKLWDKNNETTEELLSKIQCKYGFPPSGLGRRRKQKAPCTQWPWATKNKSSIPFPTSPPENPGEPNSPLTPKKSIKYPWSHQHASEAMDFIRPSNEPRGQPVIQCQSLYKSDFVRPDSVAESLVTFGRASNTSPVSLTGTNIRGNKSKNEDLQRWSSKVIERKSATGKGLEKAEEEKLELEFISKLSIDEALEKLRADEKGRSMMGRQQLGPIC